MEKTIFKEEREKNGLCNSLVKKVDLKFLHYSESVTVLDLSHINVPIKSDEIILPWNVQELNLSQKTLIEVPKCVVKLVNLRILDISFNCIEYFDDAPKFCDTLEQLNISNNCLKRVPLWIWFCAPGNLEKLDISCNPDITNTLKSEYFTSILNSKTLLMDISIYDCKLRNNFDLLSTFSNARILKIGDTDYNHHNSNSLLEMPCKGLSKCCDIEVLNLCNTNIYTVNSNIDIYKHLKHLDLSFNYIHSLPDEFCNLSNLEVCILSCNKLLYLPDAIYKLTSLIKLMLDGNELCMLPDTINQLMNLKILDLYDNGLYEVYCNLNNLEEVDFAQNYFDEPEENRYLLKKQNLRLNHKYRCDGRKPEDYKKQYDDFSDDEHSELSFNNENPNPVYDPPSSPEDWDSDDYWIPQYYNTDTQPISPWIYFVKQKMQEGNFCPMDTHPVSIVEKIKYEKFCNPIEEYESDGQFDDCSDDES